MKKDKNVTKVVFRKLNTRSEYQQGEIIALFPELIESNYCVLSYMHVGQHGAAYYNHVVSISDLATENEYKGLKMELEGMGYNLRVLRKAKVNYSK